MNLYIGAVLSSEGDGSVQHELHIACAGSLLGSKRDLLRDIRSRDDFLRLGNVVILNHDNLEVRTYLRILCRQLLQTENQVYDILCDGVGRSCLGAEDHCDRPLREIALLDLKIFIDRVQRIHLLTLILMQTLYLYIKDRVHIQNEVLCLIQILSRLFLVVMTDSADLIEHLLIIIIFHQFLQLHCILAESGSNQRLDIGRELRVGGDEPAAERNTVCLVVKFLRIKLIEILQLGFLEYLRVKRSDTVDRMPVMDIHRCHMNQIVLVDDVGCLILHLRPYSLVQLPNDRKKMRYCFLQIIDRPFFESFREDCVIGIGTGLCDNLNCLIHGQTARGQKTDQLRNYHGRMGVVNLHSDILIQLMNVYSSFVRFLQNQLRSIAYHKVLLIYTQNSSVPVTVVRIQEQGEISLDISLIKIDAVRLNHAVIDRIQVKQVQPVAFPGLISRNIDVIHRRFQSKSAERHLKRFRAALQPAVLANPRIDDLMLLVVQKFLTEQPVMIVQTHSVSAQIQRSD